VAQRLVKEHCDVRGIQRVDRLSTGPDADDEIQVTQDSQLCETAGCAMPTDGHGSPTLHAPSRSQPKICTRLAVPKPAITRATCRADSTVTRVSDVTP